MPVGSYAFAFRLVGAYFATAVFLPRPIDFACCERVVGRGVYRGLESQEGYCQ